MRALFRRARARSERAEKERRALEEAERGADVRDAAREREHDREHQHRAEHERAARVLITLDRRTAAMTECDVLRDAFSYFDVWKSFPHGFNYYLKS